ncbi:phosphorylase b kinase regulatory subunit beta-like isoform X2 [Xenia sp. Carnegie-2017]|nr:phosphorylase b kinase regulatory subunit beta-like isoform X2 [Xenia sp. Carnegie-2017]
MEASERKRKLNLFYNIVKQRILRHQSGSLGLFPLHPFGNKPNEGHVRDNVYCAQVLWALALAYRQVDDDQGRNYELEQSAVKCMRGILFCYMRQAEKVEKFKHNQQPHNSLHSMFNIYTGSTLPLRKDWPHLQIDAVALYLLLLAQMIASGLTIIYTLDEVSFIQNLVYYIERAYRTPDYGIWERGCLDNNGHRELHSSSIGMAKAALESLNGFNLFGSQGTSSSVIYVDPDAYNRNCTILTTLLPRESSSKETDAALLCIVGYPTFAVDDDKLKETTTKTIVENLMGRYGLKRFFRDGYKTEIEDPNRATYYSSELKLFEGIECEFPFLYIYLLLNAWFSNDKNAIEKYSSMLKKTLQSEDETDDIFEDEDDLNYNICVVPKYYYVPRDSVEQERLNPGSQEKLSSPLESICLWDQALYIIVKLLEEDLIDISHLDPLERHKGKSNARQYGYINHRYSSFKVIESDLVVQVALIAENRSLQATLATYGIDTQTPKQVEPLQIWPPSELVKVYKKLGVNNKLSLSGRPTRPFGSLATSKIYRILGRTIICYPIILDEKDFYMSLDMSLLIDEFQRKLSFIRNNWNMRGRPTVCLLIRDYHSSGTHFQEFLDLMAKLKRGECDGVRIRLGRLQTFLSGSCIEHLDFLKDISDVSKNDQSNVFQQIKEESLTEPEVPVQNIADWTSVEDEVKEYKPLDKDEIRSHSNEQLLSMLTNVDAIEKEVLILDLLIKREGMKCVVGEDSLDVRLHKLYIKAGRVQDWNVIRHCSGLLRKIVDSLAPAISTILVHGKVVTLGMFGHEERVVYEPLTPGAIEKILFEYCSPYDVRMAVLQQEMIIYLSSFISSNPDVFNGMLKIRVGWIVQEMKNLLERHFPSENTELVYTFPPSRVKELVWVVLTCKGRINGKDLAPRNILEQRQLNGAMHRVPPGFYSQVWKILERSESGFSLSRSYLPKFPTIDELTEGEKSFALKVEEFLSNVSKPEFRQLLVELLMVMATILKRNKELRFHVTIKLDDLVTGAMQLYNDETGKDMSTFYSAPTSGK